MYSLHLTGSPWFLLLIPPGLWILWRQYPRSMAKGGGAASPAPRRILFALQAAAMLVLAFSLTAPELRRHRVEFHNPSILILRDQSSSFRGGEYLGLGGAYRDYESSLMEVYVARKFDVRVADFTEGAWPVTGFPGAAPVKRRMPSAEGDADLTSMAAAADFVDSAGVPNLQAVFLFSDGRANLDSAKASRTWRVPLYPVVFPPDSIAEIQPERARLWMHVEEVESGNYRETEKGSEQGSGKAVEMELAWRRVGKAVAGPELRILQGKKLLLTRTLPAVTTEGGGIRFSWSPGKNVLAAGEPFRVVLTPGEPGMNMDPYNDTLAAALVRGRAERVIHVFRPIRSLDEKGMLGVLQAWEGTRVSFFGAEDIGRFSPAAPEQIWVEAGALATPGLKAWLLKSPAQAVIYARSAPGRNAQVTGGAKTVWREFSPAAEIKAGKLAAEAFPDEAVRLKSLADAPLELPDAEGGVRVEAREAGRSGMLMGRIPLGEGRQAFFFCLPAVWTPLFDPQGDFATRDNIAAYVMSAHALASEESGSVRVGRPAKVFQEVPFDVDLRIPPARRVKPEAGAMAEAMEFAVLGTGFSRTWPLSAAGGEDALESRIKGVSLPRGGFRLELRAGARVLWHDSLTVAPRAALELARIGFDRPYLDAAASRSGGRVLEPGAAGARVDEVTSTLPDLPGAQIRTEKTTSIRLYNTLLQCLLVLILLSLSWFLRKKWDFD